MGYGITNGILAFGRSPTETAAPLSSMRTCGRKGMSAGQCLETKKGS